MDARGDYVSVAIGDSWDRLQSQRFITWVNHYLEPRGLVVHNFDKDFCDGLIFINLLEVLANKKVPRYSRRPRFLSQKIDNVQIAISFLQRELGVKVIGSNPNDIVNGNVKQIMGVIFLITQKVQTANAVADDDSAPPTPRVSLADAQLETKTHLAEAKSPRSVTARSPKADASKSIQALQSIPSDSIPAAAVAKGDGSLDGGKDQEMKIVVTDKSQSEEPEKENEMSLQRSFTEDQLELLVRAQALVRGWLAVRRWKKLVAMVSERREILIKEFNQKPNALKGLILLQAVVKGVQARRRYRFKVRRTTIFEELVQTEVSYVQGLRTLIEFFVTPLRNKPEYLDAMQWKRIFEGIEAILGTNEHLLQQLKDRKSHWYSQGQRVGDIFCEIGDYLRMYASYVNNYNTALATLDEASRSNSKFRQFLNRQASNKQCKGLDIQAFLILPIQRIPRYVMLLQDMFKFTPENHVDYKDLQTALDKIRDIADYVNERKRQAENMNQVLRVQAKLTGLNFELAGPSRHFVREGPLMCGSSSSGADKHNRYCFMFNDMLLCTSPPNSTWKKVWRAQVRSPVDLLLPIGGSDLGRERANSAAAASAVSGGRDHRLLKFKTSVELKGAVLKDLYVEDHQRPAATTPRKGSRVRNSDRYICSFALCIPGKSDLIFTAPTPEDKMSWMYDLDHAISEIQTAVRSRTVAGGLDQKPLEGDELTFDAVHEKTPVMKGELFKRASADMSGGSPWRERYCVVGQGYLYWFRHCRSEKVSGWLPLAECRVESTGVMDRANCFQVDSPQMRVYFSAMDSATRFQWVAALRSEISRLIHVASRRAKKEQAEAKSAARNRTARGSNEALMEVLKLPGNHECADCSAKEPSWAHVSLGILLCAQCSGLHRRMPGAAPSIKALNMGRWTSVQLEVLQKNGNQVVNARLEKNVPSYMSKPQSYDSYAIKSKYIQAKYAGVLEAEANNGKSEDGKREEEASLATGKEEAAATPPIPRLEIPKSKSNGGGGQSSGEVTPSSSRGVSPRRHRANSSSRRRKKQQKSRVRAGYMQRRNTKQEWKRYWFVLRKDRLLYYRTKDKDKRSGSISLVLATLSTLDEGAGVPPFSFTITTTMRTHMLSTASQSECDEWMVAIQETLSSNNSNRVNQ